MATPGPAPWRQLTARWHHLRTSADSRAQSLRQTPLGRRLAAADVINRGMLFASVLLLCFVPFLIVIQSLAGRDDASGFIGRFGLTGPAARAVRAAFTSPSATSSAIDWASWIFFILGGLSAAAAIQDLYERVFQVGARGIRSMPSRLAWLAVAVGAALLDAWAFPLVTKIGGAALAVALSAIGATFFWWFSMWILLGGRRTWRELFPSAVATGLCWLGMSVVFRLVLSSWIGSDYRKYGDVGVVFAIMSLLIAIGVVLMLGALVGAAWRERGRAPQQGP